MFLYLSNTEFGKSVFQNFTQIRNRSQNSHWCISNNYKKIHISHAKAFDLSSTAHINSSKDSSGKVLQQLLRKFKNM